MPEIDEAFQGHQHGGSMPGDRPPEDEVSGDERPPGSLWGVLFDALCAIEQTSRLPSFAALSEEERAPLAFAQSQVLFALVITTGESPNEITKQVTEQLDDEVEEANA